jgi:hypothetical protein|tara:strand:- start:2975 stop:3106 length:132 start_codon:yes stop_codon:yes gene_type:complete
MFSITYIHSGYKIREIGYKIREISYKIREIGYKIREPSDYVDS